MLSNTAAAAAAPETYLRAAEAYAGYLARQGDKKKALDVLDQADATFAGREAIDALRSEIDEGKPVEPLVASPSDGAAEVLLDLGAALNRGGGESFVRLYLQLADALRPDNDATLLLLGNVAEQMDRPQDAIELLQAHPRRLRRSSGWPRCSSVSTWPTSTSRTRRSPS